MTEDMRAALRSPRPIVGDGAMGTLLTAHGLPVGTPCEEWNLERPEVVRGIHAAYLEAGSRVLTANTLSTTRLHRPDAVPAHLAELARRGVELARQVAGDAAWVAADMGPTGRLLEPYGEVSVAQAEEAYSELAGALAGAGADLILLETMTDVNEAAAALRGALAATRLPVAVTFAFDKRARTLMGQTASAAARAMERAGACATGANCGDGPRAVLAAIEEMVGATHLPLMAQANAGMPRLLGSTTQWDVAVEDFQQVAAQLASLGARWIGGCCGSTPEHVRAVGEMIAAGGP